ncbi:MAG: purple acid phosphatase family protein [Promethearchaeota archaeon]
MKLKLEKRLSMIIGVGACLLMIFNMMLSPLVSASIMVKQFEQEVPSGVRLGFLDNPSTSMAISWWTDSKKTDSQVYYGLDPANLNKKSTGSLQAVDSGYIHVVELKDLSPDTTYFYKAGGGSGNSTIFNFTTAPSPRARGVHFVALGDTRSNRIRRRIVADMVLKNGSLNYSTDVELVINTGDIVSSGDDQDLWDSYSQDVQPLASHVPIMYVPGNHEIRGLSSEYPKQFVEPKNGNEGWYYSFNWGPVHFTAVDVETHDIPLVDAMDLHWLEEDLRRAELDNSVVWKVVWFHEPMFVSFSHDSRVDLRASLGAILDKYHVDLVFNGHCHAYQRNYPVSHDMKINSTNDPYYINPQYPIHIVTGAGAVNEEGQTQDDLRNDPFQAQWHSSPYGNDGDKVFFPGNHFLNINVTVDVATNKTKLWIDVLGLNYTANVTEQDYSVMKVDEMSITKDLAPKWFEPLNSVEYTGYNTSTGVVAILKLVAVLSIIGVLNTVLIVSWRKKQGQLRRAK